MKFRSRAKTLATVGGFVVVAITIVGARLNAVPTVSAVSVAMAYPSQNYTSLNATAYVVAQRKAAVSSKATGRIIWLGVLEGSRVKQGEVIARLENEDVTAAYDQAAANTQVAQANLEQGVAELQDAEGAFKRSQELLDKKFISPASHDAVVARRNKGKAAVASLRAAVAAAQANERAARVAVEHTLIRAPFDGVILSKSANVGDNVTPYSSAQDSKGAVVTMADMDTLEVEADVAESNLAKVGINQPCEIQLEAFPELRMAGIVSRIVPTVDRAKATLLVKIRFIEKDPRVLPDMSAKIAFLSQPISPAEKKPVTVVQPKAITVRDGKQVVFVVKGDKVHEVAIQVGKKVRDLVEVNGVNADDNVVLDPSEELKDGSTVAMAKK